MEAGGITLGSRFPVMMNVPFLPSLPSRPCHTLTASLAATYGDLIMILMSRSRSESARDSGFSESGGGVSEAAFLLRVSYLPRGPRVMHSGPFQNVTDGKP